MPRRDQPEANQVLARQLWGTLPDKERSPRRLVRLMAAQGVKIGKTTIERWAANWVIDPKDAVKKIDALPETPSIAVVADFVSIMPPRLQQVARTEGVDAVEKAIATLAGKIQGNADIVVQSEDLMKAAAGGLAIFAQALANIAAARSQVALAHRNFSEGDKFLREGERMRAEGQKFLAEAEEVRAKTRADTARVVGGDDEADTDEDDAEDAQAFTRAAQEAYAS